MKHLHFDYAMDVTYREMVSRCFFTLKCFPQDSSWQTVEDLKVSITPSSSFSWGQDSFGNRQMTGECGNPHQCFSLRVEGLVTTGRCDHVEEENSSLSMVFRHPYGLNRQGRKLEEYGRNLDLRASSVLGMAEEISLKLHEDFSYRPGMTGMATTAEEAFSLGCGVCQDYAHILISLLHGKGLAARYVTGFLLGEGETHAWVEVLSDGKWYGLDPTVGKRVDDGYVRIGIGRDARDALVNKGLLYGGGAHDQKIRVKVTETEVDQ